MKRPNRKDYTFTSYIGGKPLSPQFDMPSYIPVLERYCDELENKLDKIYELCKKNDYYLDYERETLEEIFKERN